MKPYKVWTVINPPHAATFIPVNSIEEAKILIKKLINEQLSDKDIWGNAFGMVEWDEDMNEFSDWYSDDGDDIMTIIDNEDE